MKIKLQVKKENELKYKKILEESGFKITDDANLVLLEELETIDYIIAKNEEDENILVYLNEIVLIETHGKDILVHTINNKYYLKETLNFYDKLLFPYGFKRISNFSIIHKRSIVKISPALSMKFVLTLKNKMKVDVTRTYYYAFKEFIGL